MILCIDDDRDVLNLLEKILSGMDHTIISCLTGEQGLIAARRDQPDLILLDIMMPEMDGQEALRRIREMESNAGIPPSDGVKVIMISALNDKTNVMTAFREQCDYYLVKPLDKAKLVKSLVDLDLIQA